MTKDSSGSKPANTEETGWLAPQIEELEHDPEYVAEGLALQVIEQALGLMQEQGISRAELAERLGTSRAYVTKLFNAPPNLTLLSIARLALALGATLKISLKPDSTFSRDPRLSSSSTDTPGPD